MPELSRNEAAEHHAIEPRVGGAPGALAITRDAVLVLDTVSGDVLAIAPGTGRVQHLSKVDGFPTSLAVGAGSAWVVDARGGTVTRLRNNP